MSELKDGIYWVGVIDWNIRDFHGYITERGTTYNAYIIVDDKIALIDTVKYAFFSEMMDRIKKIVDPTQIDYIISNHTEPDHSGAITTLLKVSKNAELITSEPGKRGLKRYYGDELKCTTINEKPTVNLGNRTLQFVPIPMVHWPDSMVTYVPEENLLLSNDAFGQHLATTERFDDKVNQAILMHEAKTYYANIVMHLRNPIGRALKALEPIDVEMIAPSHGVIWRSNTEKIITAYKNWVDGISEQKVVIVYDTMWGSTEKIAKAIVEGVTHEDVTVKLYRLRNTHNSIIITDVLDARAVLIGSPTLNNGVFPTVASFLTYMKGLRPKKKMGAFFGSYGWGGGAKGEVEANLRSTGIEVIESGLDVHFRPSETELERAVEFGKNIAREVKSSNHE